MKTLYICFLTLFFFISANAQRSWWNYSYQKAEGSNKLFIIENSKREADTVINKNQNITIKVISKTFIETVIDTITVPQEVNGYNAILIYFNNTDSFQIEEKNYLVYLPEHLYMKKAYKSFKKYAYYDKIKKEIYTKNFYKKRTETSSGIVALYFFLLLVPFSAKLLQKIWDKKRLEHRTTQKKRLSKLFWGVMFATPFIVSIPFILFGVSDGTAAKTFFMYPIAVIFLLMFFVFENDDRASCGFIFFMYLGVLCIIGIYLHSWIVFTACVAVSATSFFLGGWVGKTLIKKIENTDSITEATQIN